jgi:hypothetical protein
MSEEREVELALIRRDVEDMQKDIQKLTEQVQGLVDAWNTASNVVAFVKWLSGAVIALTALYVFIKDGFK